MCFFLALGMACESWPRSLNASDLAHLRSCHGAFFRVLPPSYGTFSTPLRCQGSVFPVQKSTTEQTRSSSGGVQKFSGERVLWYVFLPAYVLHPPIKHIHTITGWPRFGSVRLRFGAGTVRAVPVFGSGGPLRRGGFMCFSTVHREDASGFGSWKKVPAVPVPRSVSGKTVPTVPVSGSGSVPEPPWKSKFHLRKFLGFWVAPNFQKNSRRLELSISNNTPHGRWRQGPGSVDTTFPAGSPFPVPES